ncbi:MAG: winged helix-turn-helix domain-containing protein, partial [Nitrososphaeraceae archaeon]
YLTHVQLKEFLSSLIEKDLIEYHKLERIYTITEKGMHFLEVYNQLTQLQTSNILKNTTTELQTIELTQVANQHSRYLATYNNKERARANHRWKCEKCLIPFANRNLLKIHKVENHSY